MPGKSKKGGGLEVKSAYKMKYQGGHSAFPFKSPMKHEGHGGEKGHAHRKGIEGVELPTSETMSTSVAPVVKPVVGELVDPHHSPEGYGYKAEMKGLKRKPKTLPQKLQEKKDRQKKFKKL
jgi:hypothetical protein